MSIGSAASFTLTVVAAAMMSPSSPVTPSVAARSALRYSLMRVSSTRVAMPTPSNGITSTAAARASAVPSTNPAITVKATPPEMSTRPSTRLATSSVSSRKCVTAEPADPTG